MQICNRDFDNFLNLQCGKKFNGSIILRIGDIFVFCGNKLLLLLMKKISTANFFALFFQANFFKEGRRKISTFHHCRSTPRCTYQRLFHFIVNKTERKFCPWPLPNPQPEAFIHGTEGSTFWRVFICKNFPLILKIISAVLSQTANFT